LFVLLGILCGWSSSGRIRISHCIRCTDRGRVAIGVICGWILPIHGCQNWRWLHKVQYAVT